MDQRKEGARRPAGAVGLHLPSDGAAQYTTADADRLDLAVPNELRPLKGWLLWQRGQAKPGGKFDKIPFYASGGKRFGTQGSPEDRTKLVSFDEALAALRRGGYDGLGLAMLDWGIVGLDFDNCRDEDGTVAPWVLALCRDTYMEISPSGTGIRAFYRGSFSDRKNHEARIEVFCRQGFLTVTGARLNGCDLAKMSDATAGELTRRLGPDKARSDSAVVLSEACAKDPVLARLNERGLILRDKGGGKFDITCPFGASHTTPGGAGDTVYWVPHTGGYATGNIGCLHTHCAERPQAEFRAAIGMGARVGEGQTAPSNGAAPGGFCGGEQDASSEESRLNAVETFIQSDDPAKPQRPRPQTDILIDIGLNVSKALFCGDDERSYAVVTDHREVWPIADKRFRKWLRGCYFKRVGKGANSNSIRDAIETIAAKAQFSGERRKVFLRTAEAGGKLYVDLTDDDWRVVEIDRDGWRMLGNSPVMFVRRGTPAPLPVPERGGSLSELWPFLNVPEKYRPLVAGWQLAALYPSGPYPILVLQGEEGTAKSTTARMLRSLCDAAQMPLRPPTRDERDFLVGAVSNWCVCIDNVSDMQPWLSDALCRLSTGGGFAARTLYTDCDETAVQIQRPVIINGIDVGAVRGDLVSRTITVGLEVILEDKRMSETALLAKFEKARPRILGAVFTALSQALREKPNVKLTRKPRMADFAILAVAAEKALGFEPGEFMAAYSDNIASSTMTILEASPVAQALIAFMTTRRDPSGRSEWEGTATELLNLLAPKRDDHSRLASAWPKSGRGMSALLTRFASALRRIGIDFERMERQGHERHRRLCLKCKVPAQPSAPSASVKPNSGAGLGADGSNGADDLTVRSGDQPSAPAQENSQRIQRHGSNADDADDADGPAGTLHTRKRTVVL